MRRGPCDPPRAPEPRSRTVDSGSRRLCLRTPQGRKTSSLASLSHPRRLPRLPGGVLVEGRIDSQIGTGRVANRRDLPREVPEGPGCEVGDVRIRKLMREILNMDHRIAGLGLHPCDHVDVWSNFGPRYLKVVDGPGRVSNAEAPPVPHGPLFAPDASTGGARLAFSARPLPSLGARGDSIVRRDGIARGGAQVPRPRARHHGDHDPDASVDRIQPLDHAPTLLRLSPEQVPGG